MAFDPTKPFTCSEARAHGITRAMQRGPRYVPLLRGVLISSAAEVDLWTRVEAALLVHKPGAVITHHTAAELQQLPVPRVDTIHLTVRRAADRRPQPGLRTHVGRPSHTRIVRGTRVSTGISLFRELSLHLSLVDTVVLGDALVHRGLVTVEELRRNSSPGSRAAQAARWVRAGVESPMETRLRMLLVLAGFPEPEINVSIDRDGRRHYRLDLCWLRLRLAIEYDGQHHRTDLDQWQYDLARREWFEAHDWTLLVFVSRDVFQRPAETLDRVYAAWTRSGGRAFDLRDDWRAHFR